MPSDYANAYISNQKADILHLYKKRRSRNGERRLKIQTLAGAQLFLRQSGVEMMPA